MASKFAVLALLSSTKAATFSADMSTIDCIGSTKAGDDTTYVGQYCLNAGSWTEGQCCDTSAAVPGEGSCAVAPQSDGSAYSTDAAFCGTRAAISSKFLKEFLMPQDAVKCPEYAIKQITGSSTVGSHIFDQTSPVGAEAAAWHCKYGFSTSEFKPDSTAEADRGYTYLVAENYGFDNNVIIIVQPRGKFLDFNFRSQTNNPAKMTKVFKSLYGRKYVIPAEYDVFIDFAPISFTKNTVQTEIA